MSKKSERAKPATTFHDPETHQKHLKRQLESLERDNHQSLNDVEELIGIALLAQQEEEGTWYDKQIWYIVLTFLFLKHPHQGRDTKREKLAYTLLKRI